MRIVDVAITVGADVRRDDLALATSNALGAALGFLKDALADPGSGAFGSKNNEVMALIDAALMVSGSMVAFRGGEGG